MESGGKNSAAKFAIILTQSGLHGFLSGTSAAGPTEIPATNIMLPSSFRVLSSSARRGLLVLRRWSFPIPDSDPRQATSSIQRHSEQAPCRNGQGGRPSHPMARKAHPASPPAKASRCRTILRSAFLTTRTSRPRRCYLERSRTLGQALSWRVVGCRWGSSSGQGRPNRPMPLVLGAAAVDAGKATLDDLPRRFGVLHRGGGGGRGHQGPKLHGVSYME